MPIIGWRRRFRVTGGVRWSERAWESSVAASLCHRTPNPLSSARTTPINPVHLVNPANPVKKNGKSQLNSHFWIEIAEPTAKLLIIPKGVMKSHPLLFSVACWLLFVCTVPASVLYVDLNCTNPVPPYTNWNTASTDIQSAIDSASNGDQIFVTNGVYKSGGRITTDGTTNCVVLTNAVTLQSVNGSTATSIDGGNTNRCVYMADGAVLSGFTLTRGNAAAGGGVRCDSTSSLVMNCLIISNSASVDGSGANGGTLTNCTLAANMYGGSYGGAASDSILNNCIVTNNFGTGMFASTANNCLIVANYVDGASGSTLNNCTVIGNGYLGVYECTAYNSIVYYNNVTQTGGWQNSYQSGMQNCCVPTTAYVLGGTNDVHSAPAFVDAFNGNYHLQIGSPCIDAGNNSFVAVNADLGGNPRIFNGTVDIGAYESDYTNFAGIHYVSVSSTNPASPYTNWSTAAKSIQDAIAVAQPGETVIVAAGNYTNGGTAVYGQASNRVAITNAITVLGLSDLVGTNMAGAAVVGDAHTRCVYVGSNAVLSGFIITSGNAVTGSDPIRELSGGGVWCETGGVVSNCLIIGNSASTISGSGGGAFGGTIFDSVMIENSAKQGGGCCSNTLVNCILENNPVPPFNGYPANPVYGGGAMGAILTNCTVIGNSASTGGGAASSTLTDCLVRKNSAANGAGAYLSTLENTMVVSNQVATYGGGLASCFGNNVVLVGNSAYYGGGSSGGTLTNCVFTGNSATYDGGAAVGGTLNNCLIAGNSAIDGGGAFGGTLLYSSETSTIVLNNCTIISNTASGYGGGVSSSTPYTSNYCVLNNCTLSFNSAANYGGGAAFATLNNCLLASNRVTSPSYSAGGGGAEEGVLNNCILTGNQSPHGAGADGSLFPPGIALNDCILSNNMAISGPGGGAYDATLNNCSVTGNVSTNGAGGASYCNLTNCTLSGNISYSMSGGGGAANCTLIDCFVTNNSASGQYLNNKYATKGGGTMSCSLSDCVLAYNVATNGGGDSGSTLVNCTVVSNSAPAWGGVYNSTLKNSIIYYNVGGDSYSGSTNFSLNYCCTTQPTNGMGNITNEPAFVNLAGGDFHLQSNSPCINSGNNAYTTAATDLDGNPRIVGGTVDIGAYEYQTPASVISYAWLQQYGLPMDGSVDYADLDGTAFNVYQDWRAGLNPTNPASVLALYAPSTTTNTGLTVTWQSVNTRSYYLQSSTNLTAAPAFITIQSNILGQAGTTSYTDNTATNGGPYFYRVGVQY